MKKVLLAVVLLVILSACENTGEYARFARFSGGQFKVIKESGDMRFVRDVDTGCVYMKSKSNSMFPYYDEKGNVMGCGDKRKGKSLFE